MSEPEDVERLELVEEQAKVSKAAVERGRVTVRTRIEERDELVEAQVRNEEVSVERVPKNIPIQSAPPVREEDGVLIVPVIEERLVVRTQLMLKEEIRITRRQHVATVREPVRLRSEHAEVIRTGDDPAPPPLSEELPT
jgi:uncharacterized protein (TIGR02271 family)